MIATPTEAIASEVTGVIKDSEDDWGPWAPDEANTEVLSTVRAIPAAPLPFCDAQNILLFASLLQ